MQSRMAAFWAALTLSCVLASPAIAGNPFIYVLTGAPTNLAQTPLQTKNFGTATVGSVADGAVETVTVNLLGDPSSFTVSLANIAATGDFAVTGGTCVGATGLTNGSNCSLQLRFAPTATGVRSGLLSITCNVVGAIVGVIGLVCDNESHAAYNLTGIGVLASAIPTVGREGLTLIAMLLLGASLLALRRR